MQDYPAASSTPCITAITQHTQAHILPVTSTALWHAGIATPRPSSSRSSTSPFKFVRTLAALDRPHAALSLLRARGHSKASHQAPSDTAFEESQVALSIRLQCGVFTEACSEASFSTHIVGHLTSGLEGATLLLPLANLIEQSE